MTSKQSRVQSQMRSHHKAQIGCLQCKDRHVKVLHFHFPGIYVLLTTTQCTEEEPGCLRCVQYGESCTYMYTHSKIAEESFFPPSPPQELSPENSGLSLSDLELLHQWTTNSFRGFTETPTGDHDNEFWQIEIPKLGFEFPFLLRVILASSALHLALESGIDEGRKRHYLNLAAEHQEAGLKGYRHILTEREKASIGNFGDGEVKANDYAMITFGQLVSVCSIVVPTGNSGVPEWITLVKHARKVCFPHSFFIISLCDFQFSSHTPFVLSKARSTDITVKALEETRIAGREQQAHEALIYNSKRYRNVLVDVSNTSETGVDTSLNKEDWVFTLLLQKLASTPLLPASEKAIYEGAITILRRAYALHFQPPSVISSPPPGMRFALSMWGESVSEEFCVRLEERRPMALVIFAYLTPGMKRCEYCWYMKGEAERILGDVERRLGEEEGGWRPWVEWPRSIITEIENEKVNKAGDAGVITWEEVGSED